MTDPKETSKEPREEKKEEGGEARIELYNLDISPCCKAVRFAARELGIPLKLTPVDRLNGEHLQPWFLEVCFSFSH